jgi:hypothetical protein
MSWLPDAGILVLQSVLWGVIMIYSQQQRALAKEQRLLLAHVNVNDNLLDRVSVLSAHVTQVSQFQQQADVNLRMLAQAHHRLVQGVQEIRDLLLDEAVPPEVRQRAARILNQIAGSL